MGNSTGNANKKSTTTVKNDKITKKNKPFYKNSLQ